MKKDMKGYEVIVPMFTDGLDIRVEINATSEREAKKWALVNIKEHYEMIGLGKKKIKETMKDHAMGDIEVFELEDLVPEY